MDFALFVFYFFVQGPVAYLAYQLIHGCLERAAALVLCHDHIMSFVCHAAPQMNAVYVDPTSSSIDAHNRMLYFSGLRAVLPTLAPAVVFFLRYIEPTISSSGSPTRHILSMILLSCLLWARSRSRVQPLKSHLSSKAAR